MTSQEGIPASSEAQFIPRTAREVGAESNGRDKQVGIVKVDLLRLVPAWVLLGEPGAGKSTVFRQEAKNAGGLYMSVADFINGEENPEWKGGCLFLDGLDEIQTRDDNVLRSIRNRLQRLEVTNFRISCRAADWFGHSDRNMLAAVSSSRELKVYVLEPLSIDDVKTILSAKVPHLQVQDFIEQANRKGIGSLLFNPQTLNLITKSIGSSTWPESRDEVYRRACEALVCEENRVHRDRNRFKSSSESGRINAAGRVFSALLLSGSEGVSLDRSAEDQAYPCIDKIFDGEEEADKNAVKTQLFVPSLTKEERLECVHRSVAEYLAAVWIGGQLDVHGRSFRRVLQLIQGFDGKAVGSLRGLYGWLACKSTKVRFKLIEDDPLTVALYGDLYLLDIVGRRQLLRAIKREILTNSTPFWDQIWYLESHGNLGLLFQPDLVGELIDALKGGNRDQGSQCYAAFVLKLLTMISRPSDMPAELVAEVRGTVLDAGRMFVVRTFALDLLLKENIPGADAVDLLEKIYSRNLEGDEELAGLLLKKVCPDKINCIEALRFLHVPNDLALGGYRYFWAGSYPDIVPTCDLPKVIDLLSRRDDLGELRDDKSNISELFPALVARAIVECGDEVNDGQLFDWLCFGLSDPDFKMPGQEFDSAICKWFVERPRRYESVLSLSKNEYVDARGGKQLRHGMHRWLSLLLETPSLDLSSVQQTQGKKASLSKRRGSLKARHEFSDNLSQIRDGTAHAGLMEHLAKIWLGGYNDISGEDPEARFSSYCEDYNELYDASRSGLMACVLRGDLPSEREIIELHAKKRYHRIRTACLLGMDLLWGENPEIIKTLDASILLKLAYMKLTDGMEPVPEWFSKLAEARAVIVASALTGYANACFEHNLGHIDFIYPLDRKGEYAQLARLSVPALLRSFPVSRDLENGNYLESLLWAALRYRMPELPAIITEKLNSVELPDRQRVYFLFAGALTNRGHEASFYSFASSSEANAVYVGQFMGRYLCNFSEEVDLSVAMIGRIIELLAPSADFDLLSGKSGFYTMSSAMERGEQVGALIRKFAGIGSRECLDEINRLCKQPSLGVVKRQLLRSHHEVSQGLRETEFQHHSVPDVCRILDDNPPSSQEELSLLTLGLIDDIQSEIRNSNADIFRQFWNEGTEPTHKSENSCRDALLELMRSRLMPMRIFCEPEVDYVNDKRADIRVSFPGGHSLPVEIKGQWNRKLWESMEEQLARQYAGESGHGIYVVLWFSESISAVHKDGKGAPKTAKELQQRMQNYLPEESRRRIFVRVLDLTFPS